MKCCNTRAASAPELHLNECKGVKSKAEAPFLSSWTLCLQAELISGGLRPLIPEQEQEDLETPRGQGDDNGAREFCYKDWWKAKASNDKEVNRGKTGNKVNGLLLRRGVYCIPMAWLVSYRDGWSWNRARGRCRRSAWRFPAVWGGSAGGCLADWPCEEEPQSQTRRHPSWSACTREDKDIEHWLKHSSLCSSKRLMWRFKSKKKKKKTHVLPKKKLADPSRCDSRFRHSLASL